MSFDDLWCVCCVFRIINRFGDFFLDFHEFWRFLVHLARFQDYQSFRLLFFRFSWVLRISDAFGVFSGLSVVSVTFFRFSWVLMTGPTPDRAPGTHQPNLPAHLDLNRIFGKSICWVRPGRVRRFGFVDRQVMGSLSPVAGYIRRVHWLKLRGHTVWGSLGF